VPPQNHGTDQADHPLGVLTPDGHRRPVHLLAAMEHTSRVVLAASGMLAVAAG
jgi:hypothetical protein